MNSIRPAGARHDGSRQFPEDYDSLYRLLSIAQQMVDNADRTTEASQRLLFRLLMDAPGGSGYTRPFPHAGIA